MDPEDVLEALRKQYDRGKGILKHQPVAKETCEKWTAESRELLAGVYGADSKVYRDFVTANRRILTSYDTDPSYYLTQVVANLHRELRVLERCVKEKEDEIAAAEALLALKGLKKRKPRIPAFLWAESGPGAGEVAEFLKERDFEVTSAGPGKGKGDVLWNLAAQKDIKYAVVVLSPSGKGAAVSPDGLLVTGYLAGRLGRNHVLVLVDSKSRLPGAAGFLRTVPLKEKTKWKDGIKADASKL